MPPTPIAITGYTFLTALANKIKAPQTFLQDLLFPESVHQTYQTETIQMESEVAGRDTAPFVKRDAEAALMGGITSDMSAVTAPNIRVKKPFTPSGLLFNRAPAAPIFVNGGFNVGEAAQRHILKDMAYVNNCIANTKELMAAQALQGVVSYNVAGRDNFTITYPRSSSHNIVLVAGSEWNDPNLTNYADVDIEGDLDDVALLFSDEGIGMTDAIGGAEAAAALRAAIRKEAVPSLKNNKLQGSSFDLKLQTFNAQGVRYICTIGVIDFWEHTRSINVEGVATPLIRSKYFEFFNSDASASGRELAFALIPDMTALEEGAIEAKSFSKSWLQEDPSVLWFLIHTRPLPVLHKPDTTASMKVVSG